MEKRTKEIKIRVNQKEYLELMEKKNKSRLAEWIRNVCLNEFKNVRNTKKIRTIPTEIAIEFSKIGSNINKLATAINIAVKNSDDIEIKETCEYIREHLNFIENYLDDIRIFLLISDSKNDF